MINKVSLTGILLVSSGLCLYILYSTFNFTDTEKFNSELEQLKKSAQSSVSADNHLSPTTINVPNKNNSEELVEIVISADEIKKADSEQNIGISDPYNTKFITQEEVTESITRIFGDKFSFERLEPEFQEQFITLRHTEMVQHVPEDKSTLLDALDEYLVKVKKQEAVSTEDDETTDPLLIEAEQSITETEQILQQ